MTQEVWRQLFWPAVAFLATGVAALAVRGLVVSLIGRWSAERPGRAAFAEAIRLPSLLWCVVLALYVSLEVADLPRRLSGQLHTVLEVAIILSVTVTAANLLGSLIGRAGDRLGRAVTGLAQTSARLVVILLGTLVLLSALGIQITPILTALGVGGLAVALALQDTLSNLFAGMHLLADRPIRVGDYVKLSEAGGVEGFVVDVGWRSTRIRMLANNVVIVPNHKVAQSVITNYDLPETRMTLSIPIGVSYASDPDHVERVLLEEVARAGAEVRGLLLEPSPFVYFAPGFGSSSLDFTLNCQVATFIDQFPVQHELRKRILRRFRAEKIEIPFPTHTVELRPTQGSTPPAA
jgi:small-conductance mechanosensitive channel